MKKLILMYVILLSGCVELAPASLINTVWEYKEELPPVLFEGETMDRTLISTISFIDSSTCTKKDCYNFSLPNHNGSVIYTGGYSQSRNRVLMNFSIAGEMKGKIEGGILTIKMEQKSLNYNKK